MEVHKQKQHVYSIQCLPIICHPSGRNSTLVPLFAGFLNLKKAQHVVLSQQSRELLGKSVSLSILLDREQSLLLFTPCYWGYTRDRGLFILQPYIGLPSGAAV